MKTETINQVLDLGHKNIKDSILICCGSADEALRYQAYLGEKVAHDSYVIAMHSSSLLLDRIRLFGGAVVEVMTAEGFCFSGYLKIDGGRPVVRFDEPLNSSENFDERILPLT